MANPLKNKWFQLFLLSVIFGGVTFWGYSYREKDTEQIKDTPVYTVGLVTWIGYAPLYIAKEKGFFANEKISVDLLTMDGAGLRESAFAAGQLDFFPNTPDAFILLFAQQKMNGKIVAAFDQSTGADGIVSKTNIKKISDLKDKTVGFQKGVTSHFLLLYFLHQNNLTGNDIRQINLSADDAGSAFMAGQLDAAATWEPWLSKAREAEGTQVLASSLDIGDRIVDVLLISERVIKNPEVLKAFMRAWYKGKEYIETNSEEANQIIASYLKVKSEEVPAMLKTTRFYSPIESKKYLRDRLHDVVKEISDLYLNEEIITSQVNLDDKIDFKILENGTNVEKEKTDTK